MNACLMVDRQLKEYCKRPKLPRISVRRGITRIQVVNSPNEPRTRNSSLDKMRTKGFMLTIEGRGPI
jgi:hypothetical protein